MDTGAHPPWFYDAGSVGLLSAQARGTSFRWGWSPKGCVRWHISQTLNRFPESYKKTTTDETRDSTTMNHDDADKNDNDDHDDNDDDDDAMATADSGHANDNGNDTSNSDDYADDNSDNDCHWHCHHRHYY